MSKMWMSIAALVAVQAVYAAEPVEVPEEEIATETVLPVFDQRRIVLNRNIQKTQRVELSGGIGLALNEPFRDQKNLYISGVYHFNETSGISAQFNSYFDALSTYGEQLKSGEAGIVFNPEKAPGKKYSLMINYQFDAYYGKISLSKKAVMNLSLFGTLGAGVLSFDGGTKPGLNLGMGQNFYFGKRLSLRYDLRLMIYNGPDATSRSLTAADNPAPGDFKDAVFYDTHLTVGAAFLL